jgi:hypothetical protein
VTWILASLPQHDEEVLQVHAPVITEYLLEAALVSSSCQSL